MEKGNYSVRTDRSTYSFYKGPKYDPEDTEGQSKKSLKFSGLDGKLIQNAAYRKEKDIG